MQNQYLQRGISAPAVQLYFYNRADGSPATVLFNAASLSLVYAKDDGANVALTLVTATLGTWVSSGFIARGGGVHDLYLPAAAVSGTPKKLQILATSLPTGIDMIACIVAMGADDVSAAASTDVTLMTTLAGSGGAAAREAVADTFLGRAIAGGSNVGRVVRDVFRMIRNRAVRSGNTMTFHQEDDVTPALTATITTDATAPTVVSIDPV